MIKSNLLKIESLCFNFKNEDSAFNLNNINFSLNEGEIIALVGHNGSGKTTTLKIIAGIYSTDRGRVHFNKDFIKNSKDYSLILERPILLENVKVIDFLLMCGRLLGQSDQKTLQSIDEFDQWIGVKKFKDKKIKDCSKGMKQKTSLMSSIIHSPKILLLDEPFSGLDIMTRKNLIELLNYYKKKGNAILITVHYLDEILEYCNQVVMLKNGQQVFQRRRDEKESFDEFKIHYQDERVVRFSSLDKDLEQYFNGVKSIEKISKFEKDIFNAQGKYL